MIRKIGATELHQRQIKVIRLILGIIGGLMVLYTLFSGRFNTSWFLAGLILLLAGLIGLRIFKIYRKVAVLLLNTLVLLLGLELAASVIIAIATLPATKGLLFQITGQPNDLVAHHYLKLPYYAKQEWASTYWQEHKLALRKTYHPYVIWRSPPFNGETLNIDKNGIRQTPGAECMPEAYKVFVFGGSAMWGWGAPDWGTIPAFLQADLQSSYREPVCVVNFAENAYVSTQNLIKLQLELEAGNIPDVVIFYDGVNEVMAASQTGQAILHQNFSEIAARFEEPEPPLLKWLKNLNSFQLFQMFLSQIRIHRGTDDYLENEIDSGQLVDSIAQAYLSNYKIVSSLAEIYDFDHYYFWQPYILVGSKPLTREEQSMLTGLNWVFNLDPVLVNLFKETYECIESEASAYKQLYYLADVFDGVEKLIWIDTWGHVTPEGNRLVADEIANTVMSNLASK